MLRADVTSYLSATAYADRSFANKVVDAVLWDPTRLATTAPNMDLARVVYHCRAALRRDFHLQVLLALVPAGWVVLVNLGLVLVGNRSGWWLFGGQLVLAYLAVYTVCAWFHPRRPGRQWLPLPLAALTAYFIWRQGVPVVATLLLGMTWPIVLVVFGYRWWNRHRLSAPVLQGQWPHTGLALRKVVHARLQQINTQARGNIAAFPESNRHQLVGCGELTDFRGLFTMRLDRRADSEREIKDFEVVELVDALKEVVPTIDLTGIWAEDRVYVSDETLAYDPAWHDPATGLPKVELERPQLEVLMRHPEPFARHYLCIRVVEPSWKGHLAFTMAVHFHKTPVELTIESNKFVYRPLKFEYRQIDRVLSISPNQVLTTLWQALIETPRLINSLPGGIAEDVRLLRREVWNGMRLRRIRRKPRAVDQRIFDLRGDVSATRLHEVHGQAADFQQADVDRYREVIEEVLLRAIQQFLSDHNINTSDLTDESTNIFNNVSNYTNYGIIGQATAETIAVGQNVTANASAAPNRARAANAA
jgi:hypothetical protein